MGKITKNWRQTKRARSADQSAAAFAKYNRFMPFKRYFMESRFWLTAKNLKNRLKKG